MNSLLIVWLALPVVAILISRVCVTLQKSRNPPAVDSGTSTPFLDPLDYLEIEQEHIRVEYDRPVTQTDVRQLVLPATPTAS